jgi:hypothetical protein
VVRDCNIVSKWKLPSEAAALAELRKRVILKADTNRLDNVDMEVLRIGFEGVVAEHDDLQALSQRLMEDVHRIIAKDSAKPVPVGASKF